MTEPKDTPATDPRAILQERLGYQFNDPSRLERALTHRSFANEEGLEQHYERLEFLGDAVLGMVAADWFFHRHPTSPEGTLTRYKSRAVREPALVAYARRVGLGPALRLGVGEDRSGGRTKASLLADAMEAVLGSIYLDGGLESVRRVIVTLLEANDHDAPVGDPDPKSALQEWSQSRGTELPEYVVIAESGPDHEKAFTVECRLGGQILGRAEASSKKRAEQAAAAAALRTLEFYGKN